jgi:GNAT superfamily N-acetyltransferase
MVEFHEVDESRWPDLVRLMQARGGPAHCWCVIWRDPPDARRGFGRPQIRGLMEARVRAGIPIGILAYEDGEPAGWCSVAPRETYRDDLAGPGGPDDHEGVWSIVCFFLPRPRRGQGLGEALLGAAIDTARRHGARVVEAYPVDPESPSYRYMGFVSMFARAGFREIGRAGLRRHIMRLDLASDSTTATAAHG